MDKFYPELYLRHRNQKNQTKQSKKNLNKYRLKVCEKWMKIRIDLIKYEKSLIFHDHGRCA